MINHSTMKHLVKITFSLLIWIAGTTQLAAAPISLQQAEQNVKAFLEAKGKSVMPTSLRFCPSKSSSTNAEYYYVFNIGNHDGYVIAAGDDCAPAILGYADSGSVNLDSLPENMKAWLEEYAQQIQYMQQQGSPPYKTSIESSDFAAISPLLTTTWGQQSPYNQNCPDFFSYGKSVTGCVATAMAQVMYYHRATSVTQTTATIPAYDCRTLWLNGSDTLGHIHVDSIPAGSPIDWDNMLDSYKGSTTAVQKEAIANLMKYCGAAVQMNYANAWNGGSGAYSEDVAYALEDYFNYSYDTQLIYRAYYSSDIWESFIYNELGNSRPVYYSGSNSSSGHAFVCDGYDGDGYFHINWGWTGTSDGYFLLSALDPSEQGTGGSTSGYNYYQTALINAQPKTILASSISLNKINAEMTVGETLQLTATVLPANAANKSVTWSTNNSSVASVDSNGLVTAIAPDTVTITATTTDGSNLSASCIIIVHDLYTQDNYLSMNDTTVFHGSTFVIPVAMTNAESIISFQTDIFMPEGLEIVQEEGDYLIEPSGRMTRTHSLTSNYVSNGAVRVLCYSSNYKPFTGNSGDDLFYITVKAADDAVGNYTIQLKNTLLTTSDFTEITALNAVATVNVLAYIPGDANNNGIISVTDVVATAQYVLELNPQPFNFEAADMNNDNSITVADISRIAYMVLNPTQHAPLRAPAQCNNDDRMCGNDFTLSDGETHRVSIVLDNEMDYSAFQFDLTLPDGLTASNFALTNRAGSHAFDVNTLTNGKTRVLCYSPKLTAISDNEGAILTFDVTASGAATGDIHVDGIELVTTDCQTMVLDDFTIGLNTATGIDVVTNGKTIAHIDYYNIAGQRIDKPNIGVALVVITYDDGTRSIAKVIQ